MRFSKSIAALVVIGAASAASAAIIPSWRINPISPAAVTANPALAGAVSVSLMVELTDGSLFNVAGLDLDQIFEDASGGSYQPNYFNQAFGSANNKPNPGLVALFPDLAFDSYVATTNDASAAATPGRLNGTGAAQVGDGAFNVAWGATPNTGGSGAGPLEIARITWLASSGLVAGINTPVPGPGSQPVRGRVSGDSGGPVALPPIPVGIPEPTMGIALAGLALLAVRRK